MQKKVKSLSPVPVPKTITPIPFQSSPSVSQGPCDVSGIVQLETNEKTYVSGNLEPVLEQMSHCQMGIYFNLRLEKGPDIFYACQAHTYTCGRQLTDP